MSVHDIQLIESDPSLLKQLNTSGLYIWTDYCPIRKRICYMKNSPVFYPIENSVDDNLKQGLKLAIPVSVVLWMIIISVVF